MLSDKLVYHCEQLCHVVIVDGNKWVIAPVKDTELLQIVWEISRELRKQDYQTWLQYCRLLEGIVDSENGGIVSFSLEVSNWQQRTIALAAIKNIEIV